MGCPKHVPESVVAILSGGAESGAPDLAFSRTHLFVRDIVGGPNQVRVFDLDGKPLGKLPLPEVSSNDEIVPLAVTLDDGTTAHRVFQCYLDTYTWRNPRTNASLRWTVPRDELRVIPVRAY